VKNSGPGSVMIISLGGVGKPWSLEGSLATETSVARSKLLITGHEIVIRLTLKKGP
jgi:hypothetical protein